MSHFDTEILAELREDMEDDFGELVDSYVEDAELLMNQIEVAFSAGDGKGLQDAAHALKSSSGYLGAQAVAEHCNKIETCGRLNTVSEAEQSVLALKPALSATLDELRVYSSD